MFRVLLVEDNHAYRHALGDLLAARFPQLQINEASDGDRALLLSRSVAPDLILLGVQRSECNGLDLTRQIKQAHPRTVVVVLGGYDLPEYRNSFARVGADHFVAANIALDALFALVESIIRDFGSP